MDDADEIPLTFTDKVLFTTGLPLLALVAGLLLFSFARSHGGPAEPADAKQSPPAAAAAQKREEEAAARRDLYRDCMKAQGAVATGYGRFRRQPDRGKVRDAHALCITIVNLPTKPPTPNQQGLPIA